MRSVRVARHAGQAPAAVAVANDSRSRSRPHPAVEHVNVPLGLLTWSPYGGQPGLFATAPVRAGG